MASSSGGGIFLAGACQQEIDSLGAKLGTLGQQLHQHFEMVQEAQDIIQAQLNRLIVQGAGLQSELDKMHSGLMRLRGMVDTPPPPPAPAAAAATAAPAAFPAGPPPLGKAPPSLPWSSGVQDHTALVPVQPDGLPPGIHKDNYYNVLQYPEAPLNSWPITANQPDAWTHEIPGVSALYPQNLPQAPLKPPPGTPKTFSRFPQNFAQVPKKLPLVLPKPHPGIPKPPPGTPRRQC